MAAVFLGILATLAFADRTALLAARDVWCTNSTQGLATYGPIGQWQVGAVTDLSHLFCTWGGGYQTAGCNPACSNFNEDIGHWNVSQVINLQYTFLGASAFNQPLNSWSTSNVVNMRDTFHAASVFNQALDRWDVSKVSDTNRVFYETAMSDCNKALIALAWTPQIPSWSYSSWSQDTSTCPSPPPALPPGPPPSPRPTTLYIRGSRSQIVFGTNGECTLELAFDASSLTSSCPINTPSSRRLEDASNGSDRVTQLEARMAQLEMDKAEMKEQIQFITTGLKMLKEQRKAQQPNTQPGTGVSEGDTAQGSPAEANAPRTGL